MEEFIVGTANGAQKLVFICALGLAIEYLRPAEKEQPASNILFNTIWLLNFLVVTNFLMMHFQPITQPAIEALGGPLIQLNFEDTGWGWFGQFMVFVLMHDFFYYWFHRCQHTWRWFWAHHKLHHTDEHMNATTSFRHHWLENVYRIPFIYIPMGFLVELNGYMPALIWDLSLAWAVFTHMNLRLSMGPFTRFFAGPQVHRIHHSVQREHQDKNFGAFFPIWDQMFGTYWHPQKDEYPATGTLNGETTDGLMRANFGVFRDWYALAKPNVSRLLRRRPS